MIRDAIINVKEKRLEYSLDEIHQICDEEDSCFIDKTEARDLLIGVIENFNKANPKFAIKILEEQA